MPTSDYTCVELFYLMQQPSQRPHLRLCPCLKAGRDASEVAREIANRLERIFLRDKSGRRPVYGGTEKFQTDPQWKDYLLFFEYFHGDNGAGLGASHQTGWTGVIAKLIELFGRMEGQQLLDAGKAGAFVKERTKEKETVTV
jgi:hypothetical protein